ncbi:type II secretion system protein [Sulfurimonas sp.]|jgi:prepilin-type N-terminal cleavage/methylation domain-containing protein|uniref:type II secretion system protein n=1 Tax=Sulfurimonas sp. TaxID=2022749 RepID=UPI002A3703B6|nr:type II secretion system protein [Sulfurimonas sp.]MDY0124488.1 type II secretion system protein [Sulfurimonas sp.]
MRRAAFTLLELIFVIVIMGILARFGIELLSQAYKSFIFSSVNNALQSQSAAAVETIAARLQYRIKDSVIAREADDDFFGLAGYTADNAPILEWVGMDADGLRGDSAQTTPLWSGIIDLQASTAAALSLPQTDTGKIGTLINTLSNGGSSYNDVAFYFIGSDSDVQNGYGWTIGGGGISDQNHTMHPVTDPAGNNIFNFSNIDVYEYYQLAWTAYAVVHNSADDTLWLHYDYQPWKGENYNNANTKKVKIMDNVDTFQFIAAGSIVKIQVCVNSDLMEDYSLCKEKTVF